MKVAVVGAGLAGLAAARELHDSGHQVVVFEKSKGVGGRLATRRIGPYTFDTGATSLTPRGRGLEEVVSAMPEAAIHRIERPIHVHEAGRTAPGDAFKNAIARYACPLGITQVAKHLSRGLEVRLEHRVEKVVAHDGGADVDGEAYEGVIVTAPAPQALELVGNGRRPLGFVRYRSCLSVLLGYEQPLEPSYFALIDPTLQGVVTWISLEHLKTQGRAPEGHSALVVQLSARVSQWWWEHEDEAVVRDTLPEVVRLFGRAFAEPAVAQVKRWRYSQPESTIAFEVANRPGSRVLVAGDALVGGRAELAYESGLSAAQALLL